MWSIVITVMILSNGTTKEVYLRGYYETKAQCEQTTYRLYAAVETREGIDASIGCVEGWKINWSGK